MLAKLIIILIIIVIFILLFLNLNKKEGFQTTQTTQSGSSNSVELNTECYKTSLTKCVGKCNILEKEIRRKCLNKNKCSVINNEDDCDDKKGCSFKTNIKSNCEGKNKANCSDDICVWEESAKKCFEKNSNYEKDKDVINSWSPKCRVEYTEYSSRHPKINLLKESQKYIDSNNKSDMVEDKRKELFKKACKKKEGCLYKKPGDWGYGSCEPDHPCRRYKTEHHCVKDKDNECVANFDYKDNFYKCEPAENMFEKITTYSGWNKKAGYLYGKKMVDGGKLKLFPEDCGKDGNPENFVYEGNNYWSKNYCYSDYRLCEDRNEWHENRKPVAPEVPENTSDTSALENYNKSLAEYNKVSDYNYTKLFNDKCFSMKASPNHTNLLKYDDDYSPNTFYPHSLLRDPSKIKYFSCEEIKKIYLYSKMVLNTSVHHKCVNLPDNYTILVGSSVDNDKTKSIENLHCYDIPTELDKEGPTDEKPNKGRFNEYWSGYPDTFSITKNKSSNEITVKRTDIEKKGWGMNLEFSVKKKQNKKITEEDQITARKFIDYVDNMSSEEIQNIFGNSNKKCLVLKECLNVCSNKKNKDDCHANSKECKWISDNALNQGYCIRKMDEECNSNTDNCSGENCETNIEYDYRFCAPKLNCEKNEYFALDENGNTICKKCPPGTFLKNGICKNCGFNEFSDTAGSLECKPKTTCQVDNHYVSIKTDDINISDLSENQINSIKHFASTVKDISNLKEDRQCTPLNKCSMTESKYATNYHDYIDESLQKSIHNDIKKIEKLAKHINDKNSYRKCPEENKSFDYAYSDSYMFGNDYYESQPKTRYSDYNCEDLTKCDKNQFIANYDMQKKTKNGMYVRDRKCADSSNCLEGTYEDERVSPSYPVFDIEKDGETYKVFSRDRNCLACEDNYYSDTPNATKCTLQPLCEPGKRVDISLEDFINSDNHELVLDNFNIEKIKSVFYVDYGYGEIRELQDYEKEHLQFTGIENNTSTLDLFFNPTTQTSGKIKFIKDNDNELEFYEFYLFEYSLENNKLKLTSKNGEGLTFIYNKGLNHINFKIKINEVNVNGILRMKNSISKKKILTCTQCNKYSYTDEENRLISCKPQPLCQAGYLYNGDPVNRDSKSSCSKCADNTYIESPGHRIESCKTQPFLQKGKCSMDYNPKDTTKRMTIVNANGITNYQDKENHREPCIPQTKCDKGQLINEPNPVAARQCENIQDIIDFDGTRPKDLIYMDVKNHRNQVGKTNPVCPEGETLDFQEVQDNKLAWTYTPYVCVDEEDAVSAGDQLTV